MKDLRFLADRLRVAPIAHTAEEFQAFLRTDVERWAKVVRASGARAD